MFTVKTAFITMQENMHANFTTIAQAQRCKIYFYSWGGASILSTILEKKCVPFHELTSDTPSMIPRRLKEEFTSVFHLFFSWKSSTIHFTSEIKQELKRRRRSDVWKARHIFAPFGNFPIQILNFAPTPWALCFPWPLPTVLPLVRSQSWWAPAAGGLSLW